MIYRVSKCRWFQDDLYLEYSNAPICFVLRICSQVICFNIYKKVSLGKYHQDYGPLLCKYHQAMEVRAWIKKKKKIYAKTKITQDNFLSLNSL